ncbi:uncharacterized protein [Oscarella lobularis]|uniref:uncharacterized protein n=1 Tax=Oscarella lobularis TaxID=121494 RepID=UPI0033130F71
MALRLVFYGDKSLRVEDVDLPRPLPENCILARIRMATICGSDLHTIEGRRSPATPCILGHEAIAEIVENRRADSTLKCGDRITFQVADCCRECENCNRGLRSELNGCFATHIVIHPRTFCVAIPDNVPDNIAATINCALATVVNVLEEVEKCLRSDERKSVVIQGSGMLGLFACALLRESGFDKVYCTDAVESRLELARKFGATTICIGKNDDDLPSENSVDAVIEICGVPSVVQQGIKLLRTGGVYILAGLVHPKSKLDITGLQIISKCLTIKGVHNYSSRHLSAAVDFLSRTVDKYPYEELFSEPHSLRNFDAAYDLALSRKFLRVCFNPQI